MNRFDEAAKTWENKQTSIDSSNACVQNLKKHINLKENSKEKFIIVPFSAILAWTVWEHRVFVVWSWNIIEEKKVKTWTSNSNEVIINSWLEEWQKVVVSWTLDV